jgi:hypothetical protein
MRFSAATTDSPGAMSGCTAQCAVQRAWRVDTDGHTYQLFDSKGCPSRIDAEGRQQPEPTLTTPNRHKTVD